MRCFSCGHSTLKVRLWRPVVPVWYAEVVATSLQRWENAKKNTNFSKNLELQYISAAKYEGDWHSTLHAHQCAEIFYVVDGEGQFRVEDTVFPVQKDWLVIINSNVEHTETSSSQKPLEYIVMGVAGSDFLLKEQQDSRYCAIDSVQANREILAHMQNILLEMEHKSEYYETMVHDLLQILSIKLLRSMSVTMPEPPTSRTSMKCAHIKRYIDSHYKENITIDVLAKVAFLNKSYLIHIFTREYGEPPISYLVKRRVEESRYLLAQTDYSISEIGLMMGFSSPSYFSQSFSRIEGLSPKEFRRRAKLEKEKGRDLMRSTGTQEAGLNGVHRS